jgi:hypothetical protein
VTVSELSELLDEAVEASRLRSFTGDWERLRLFMMVGSDNVE